MTHDTSLDFSNFNLEKGFLSIIQHLKEIEIISYFAYWSNSGRLPNGLVDETRCYIINYAHPPHRQKGKLGDPVWIFFFFNSNTFVASLPLLYKILFYKEQTWSYFSFFFFFKLNHTWKKKILFWNGRSVFNAEILVIFSMFGNYSLEFKEFPGHCEIFAPFPTVLYPEHRSRWRELSKNCKFKRDCIKWRIPRTFLRHISNEYPIFIFKLHTCTQSFCSLWNYKIELRIWDIIIFKFLCCKYKSLR